MTVAPVSATEPVTPRVYAVREAYVPTVEAAVVALNRRAARLGLPPACVTVVGTRDVTHHNELGLPYIVRYVDLTVVAADVKLPGWSFAAAIDHLTLEDGERANLVRQAPTSTVVLPAAYRTDAATCDHCRTARDRRQTFVVVHDDGRTARIGRSCLAAYTGAGNAELIVAAATWLGDYVAVCNDLDAQDGYSGGGGGRVLRFGVPTILAYAAAAIRLTGWTSRKAARDEGVKATADDVWDYATYSTRRPSPHEQAPPVPTADDVALAEATLAWVRTIPADTENDYLHGLRVACLQGSISAREVGLASSAISAYVREQGRAAAAAAEATALPGHHVGAVGDKITGSGAKGTLGALEAVVTGRYSYTSDYGVTTILRFRTATGADLVWYSSTGADARVDRGAVVVVEGTVKKHEADKRTGRPTTVLSRCTVTLGTLADVAAEWADRHAKAAQAKVDAKAAKATHAASPAGLAQAVEQASNAVSSARDDVRRAKDALERSGPELAEREAWFASQDATYACSYHDRESIKYAREAAARAPGHVTRAEERLVKAEKALAAALRKQAKALATA